MLRLRSNCEFGSDAEDAIRSLPVRVVEFEAGSDIHLAGEKTGASMFVVEGMAASYKIEADGARQISCFYLPGDMPDLYTLHLRRADSSMVALQSTTIGAVFHHDVRALCHANSEVCDVLWRATLIEGALVREWVSNVGRRNALSRVSHLLCEFVTRMAAVGLGSAASCRLPVTQNDLADATGLTTVHMNRTLQELRHARPSRLTRRSLSVLDWDRLVDVQGFDPSYLFLRGATGASA